MSKQRIHAVETIPAHEVSVVRVTLTCDECGVTYDPDDHRMNEIVLAMDPDECVSYVWRRDYCAEHAQKLWDKLCAVLGVDPDEEGQHGFGEYE